ncbi:polar amino acid transport system substrate-binding protein [Pseudomonas cuatrocienegasensis]|uniref:Polar amino acid transport system substrate-binding protein n=1 Tax=Pseudomonas cuatrocienegasensis TaxID=543360 RepID=A0ABY1B6L4_9PSED|nr:MULTISPECIES: transporter substrate-binding domain-containing protein [Pseudomonas]OEC36869.1 ABC transporter permease [Pseudomonas sp. 21C1]SEQ09137.1 polar amino acid transport system substrate-binding protein [Pseudomonas cuatrocienegasensis]
MAPERPLRRFLQLRLWLLLLLPGLVAPALAEVIRIGAEDDWYPYTAYREGRVQGMSVDILRAAFAATGQSVELLPYPYARCMEMARSGELVACFNTSPNARIRTDYQLPQQPLFSDDILLWARQDQADAITDFSRLDGKRVAVTLGYEYGPILDQHTGVERIPVRRDLNGFLMLQRQRVDFTAAYRGTAQALFVEHPELAGQFAPVAVLHRPQLYLSVSRRHPLAAEVLERFDRGMQQLHHNGRYQQILLDWQHPSSPAD